MYKASFIHQHIFYIIHSIKPSKKKIHGVNFVVACNGDGSLGVRRCNRINVGG